MPGVLLVEAMAQTAAVVVGITRNYIDERLLTYFMGVDNCKFRRMVQPGDVAELHVRSSAPAARSGSSPARCRWTGRSAPAPSSPR